MKLIKAWTGDLDRAYELFGKFQADEHGFVNDAYGLSRDEWPFAVWCGWVCQVVTVLRSSLPQVR